MSTEVRNLTPKALWNNFADLNAVPRPSKKEARVIQFIKSFGENLGLKTFVDEVGNIIIKKPASQGMENRAIVALQSHIDMVHQKNATTDFDFDTQGIKMLVNGDWVKADGTTLGADNGIGVASIMTILAATDIVHPPIEALFTIDEETGMTGAIGLIGGLLDAEIMLNLDTEDDNELTIGCAGGVDVTATGHYNQSTVAENTTAYRLTVKGLSGGHSGMEIHLGKGNANKIMNRILFAATKELDISVAEIDGGGLRNAIPRESFSIVVVPDSKTIELESFISEQEAILKSEHNTTDPNLVLTLQATILPEKVLSNEFQTKVISAIYACPNGIYRMSPDIEDLVQTSNNIARVLVKNGEYIIQCLTRSSVDSEKTDLAQSIQGAFELIGAAIELDGSYPGWTPKPDAPIIKTMSDLYQEMFNESAEVSACHAGLECGILGTHYPEMQMISFGPNIRGAHSPDEKVQISSVQKYWKYFLETLKRTPEKSQ